MSVSQTITDVLEDFGFMADEHTISMLAIRVHNGHPEQPEAYARNVARNWCVDQRRAAVVRHNKEVRKRKRDERQAEMEHWQGLLDKAHEQFWSCALRTCNQLSIPRSEPAVRFLLLYLWVFERKRDNDLTAMFPTMTRASREQQRHRARKAMLRWAPAELKEVLEHAVKYRRPLWLPDA